MINTAGNTGKKGATEGNGEDKVAKAPKARGAGLAVFLSLVSLLAAGAAIGGAYYFYTREYVPLKQGVAALGPEMQQQLSTQSEAVSNELQQQLQSVEQINQGLVTRQESLENNFTGIREDLAVLKYKADWGQREWTLAEVGYLLRMAEDRLLYMRDVNTAKAALRTAGNRIEKLADPTLVSLLEQVRADLNALSVYTPPRAEEVLAPVEQIIAELRPLPSVPDSVPPPIVNKQAEEAAEAEETVVIEEEASPWSKFIADAKEQLKSRVRVVEHGQRLNAVEQNTVRRYQLEMASLRLEAMRMALQRDDAAAFERERLALDAWAQSNLTKKRSVAMREALQVMSTESLFKPLPDLAGSWQVLRDLVGEEAPQPVERPEPAPEPSSSEPGASPASDEDATPEQVQVPEPQVSQPVESDSVQVEATVASEPPPLLNTHEGVAPAPMPELSAVPGPSVVLEPPAVVQQPEAALPAPAEEQAVPLPEAVVPGKEGKPEVM